MGNNGLGGGYISDADLSFKMVCLHLLEMAYCEVRTTCTINKDWTENAISEALKKGINDNEETIWMHITAEVEVKQLPTDLSSMPSRVDDAPRIDIKVGGFDTRKDTTSRVCYYMEAKNLYSKGFKKSDYSSYVSSTYYAKRYISTGIDHLLGGYYPSNTILIGYVLVGTVQAAVDIVNQHLVNDLRGTESIDLQVYAEYPALVLGASTHPNGKELDHCFLQF